MSLAVVPAHLLPSSRSKPATSLKGQEKSLLVNDLPAATSGTLSSAAGEVRETSCLALAGINSSESSQKLGKNDHFRVFNVSTETSSGSTSISLLSKNELLSPTTDVESYQRLICTKGLLAAIASGGGLAPAAGSEIVVVALPDLDLKRRIRLPGKDEAADLDLSDAGLLVYCTAKDIFVTSINGKDGGDPRKLTWQSTPTTKGSLRSVRFCGSPGHIVVALNYPHRAGSELLLIDATSDGKILTRKKLHKNIKAVTGMDAVSFGPHQEVVAIAGADQSVEILVIENDTVVAVKAFRDVHPFQITRVAFSPAPRPLLVPRKGSNSIRLATTSIGNTVVVFTLPLISGKDGRWKFLRGSLVVKQTVFSVLLSLIGVVIFAVVLQLMFEARAGLPLPMERNAIISRFNEVLGAKRAETAILKEAFTVLKEVDNGDDEADYAPHTVIVEEVVMATLV